MIRTDYTDRYLAWAADMGQEESDLRDAVLDWLPPNVTDVHSHASEPAAFTGFSEYGWRQARSSFPSWSVDRSMAVRDFLYGPREVRQLRFAFPFLGFDHRRANAVLLADTGGRDAVALCGLPDDPDYTTAQLRSGRYHALKMYPHYFEPPAQRIRQYFTDEAVAVANELAIPLILHVAEPLSGSAAEVIELARRCEGTRVILAHLAREPKATAAARAAFERTAAQANVALDTSMCINPDIYRLAFQAFGPDRVLFGSDEPYNLLRYVQFDHPSHGVWLVAPRRYHWMEEEDFDRYKHLAGRATCVHWAALDTLRSVIGELFGGQARAVAEQVLGGNAGRWFPGLAG